MYGLVVTGAVLGAAPDTVALGNVLALVGTRAFCSAWAGRSADPVDWSAGVGSDPTVGTGLLGIAMIALKSLLH